MNLLLICGCGLNGYHSYYNYYKENGVIGLHEIRFFSAGWLVSLEVSQTVHR